MTMPPSRHKKLTKSKKSKAIHQTAEVLIKQEPDDFEDPVGLEENIFGDIQFDCNDGEVSKVKKKRHRAYAPYTPETLQQALADVRSKRMSKVKASKEYKIPLSTLKNRIRNKNVRKVGAKGVFDEAAEGKLVDWLHDMADLGDARTSRELTMVSCWILKK